MSTILKALGVVGAVLAAGFVAAGAAHAGGAGEAAKGADLRARSLVESIALGAHDVRRVLQARGYYNIVLVDRELPVYRAVACKRGDRFALQINRFGEIRDRIYIGRCVVLRRWHR